jgi:hypothetical protein
MGGDDVDFGSWDIGDSLDEHVVGRVGYEVSGGVVCDEFVDNLGGGGRGEVWGGGWGVISFKFC